MNAIVEDRGSSTTGEKISVLSPNKDTKWTVSVEEDPDTGELLLPLPPGLLEKMGWNEETKLWWNIDENNNVCITVKVSEDTSEKKSV